LTSPKTGTHEGLSLMSTTMRLSHRDVRLSRLDKELFPAEHLTKRDVIDYYRAVADVMLPHLTGRPLVLRRYPDGIDAEGFVQQEASRHFPEWVAIARAPRRDRPGTVDHVVCDDAATLVYLANQATVEFHTWLSTTRDLERPDRVVIDIDPPHGVDVASLRAVARNLRDLFSSAGLTPYVQATGGRGFHVLAPLDGTVDFDGSRDLAKDLADRLVERDPDRLTTAIRKERRGNRIFLDVNRNAYGQTFVAPYSLRARPGAPVATPLDWSELGRATPNGYDPGRIRRRLARKADPWASVGEQPPRR
jgi:bifunctional non-homologous end joining protein LigD